MDINGYSVNQDKYKELTTLHENKLPERFRSKVATFHEQLNKQYLSGGNKNVLTAKKIFITNYCISGRY